MRMHKGIVFGLLTLALAAWAVPARAELTITIGSAQIAQGTTGTVDVLISSDNNDQLNSFSFELQISGPNELQFVQPSGDTWVTSTNPQYLLQNATLAYDASLTGDSVSNNGSGKNNQYDGTNQTTTTDVNNNVIPGPDVTLATGVSYLLVALQLDTTNTSVGDQYTISLAPGSGTGSVNDGTPNFFDTLDSSSNEVANSGIPYTSNPGTITIVGASVPEPGSLVLGLGATAMMAGVGAVRRRRGRKGPVR